MTSNRFASVFELHCKEKCGLVSSHITAEDAIRAGQRHVCRNVEAREIKPDGTDSVVWYRVNLDSQSALRTANA